MSGHSERVFVSAPTSFVTGTSSRACWENHMLPDWHPLVGSRSRTC